MQVRTTTETAIETAISDHGASVPLATARSEDRSLRVVAVEDDPTLLHVITEVLTDDGCQVKPLTNWREAYPTVIDMHPDVVVLDLTAEGRETGWTVMDQLILNPETRSIPVVLTTGAYASIAARQPALRPQDGIYVLLKPFDLDALCKTVQKAAQRSGPAERAQA
jgi:CheY-like chemotaxis protein